MTKWEIHEALCAAPDDQKMRLCIACQMHGVSVETIEETLAKIITGVQASLAPALRDYEYLGGGRTHE